MKKKKKNGSLNDILKNSRLFKLFTLILCYVKDHDGETLFFMLCNIGGFTLFTIFSFIIYLIFKRKNN